MRNMRTIAYAQQIVTAQPSPPRVCNPWMILRTQLSMRVWLLVGSQFAFVCYRMYYSAVDPSTGAERTRYNLFLILLAVIIPLALYGEIVKPWWSAWHIIRFGNASIAEIHTVKRHTVYYREVVEGTWRVADVYSGTNTLPFRLYVDESGGWIRRIAVGSHIHVLTHATKPHLAMALGFVVPTTGDDEQSLM